METNSGQQSPNAYTTSMFFPSPQFSYTVHGPDMNILTLQSAIQSLSLRMTAIEASAVASSRINMARIRALEAEIEELCRKPSPRPHDLRSPATKAMSPHADPFVPSNSEQPPTTTCASPK